MTKLTLVERNLLEDQITTLKQRKSKLEEQKLLIDNDLVKHDELINVLKKSVGE